MQDALAQELSAQRRRAAPVRARAGMGAASSLGPRLGSGSVRAITDSGPWGTVGQFPAGMVRGTVANSALEDDSLLERVVGYLPATIHPGFAAQAIRSAIRGEAYRPSVIDQPGAVYGIIQALTQDEPNPDSYGQRSLRRAIVARDRTNRMMNVPEPRNLPEVILDVAGSMVVPGPKMPAVNATTRLGRAGQYGRNIAGELTLPLRNTSYPLATTVGSIVGGGLMEVLDAAHDDPTYTGIGDMVRGGTDNSAGALDRELSAAAPREAQPEDALAQELGLPSSPELATSALDTELGGSLGSGSAPVDTGSSIAGPAAIVSTIVGGAVAMRYMRNRVTAQQANLAAEAATESAPEGRAPIVGTRARRSRNTGRPIRRVREAVASKFAPVTDWFRDVVSADEAERVGWRASRLTNTALGRRVERIITAGRYSGHSGRYTPAAQVGEAIARDLTPDEQQQLFDAVIAARALDDLENTGNQTALTRDYTPTQMRQLVHSTMTNPRLMNYFQSIQRVGRDQLRFAVREGLLTPEQARAWATERPNWAKFNRALQEDRDFSEIMGSAYTANRDSLGGVSSTREGGSVQAGAVENPLQAMIGNWSNLVRMAEVNNWRREVLASMDGVRDGTDTAIVTRTRYTPGITSKDPNVHVVFDEAGKRIAYRVNDPAISLAMHIKPRASAMQPFEAMRSFFQQMTTGPIGSIVATGFNVAASPVFDALGAMVTRKPGQVLGPLNNLILAATRGRAHIGVADVTAPLGGYYGAVRYMLDEFSNRAAQAFERRLIQNNSMLVDLLGEAGVRSLAEKFRQRFEQSVKAFGDDEGAFSATLHGSPDPGKPLVHLEHVAPHFTREQIGKYYQDLAQSDPRRLAQAIARSKSAWIAVRASPLARAVGLINEALHNGQRYTALANARYTRGFQDNIEKVVAETRRLGGDQSQHGSSDRYNQLSGMVPYMAQGTQAIYEMGRTLVRYPKASMINMGVAMPLMLATSYLTLLNEDETREEYYSLTPEQQARIMPMPGGIWLPITPELRLPLFMSRTILDELLGIEDGEINTDLVGAFERMIDGDTTSDEEEFQQALTAGAASSIQEAIPFDVRQIPLVQGAFGAAGIDPGSIRHGELREAYVQRISGLETDRSQIGAVTTSNWEAFISGITGAAGAAMVDLANDFAVNAGERGFTEGLDAAGNRWIDMQQRRMQRSPLRPLFGQYESLNAVRDANWQLYRERSEGIDAAVRVLQRNVMAPAATGLSQPLEMPGAAPVENVQGTAAHTIGLAAQSLQSDIRPLQARMSALSMQAEGIRNAYTMTPEDQNRSVNSLNRERQAISLQLLMMIRDREDYIGQLIGDDDFTFDGYQPEDYLQPIAAPVPSQ